MNQEPTDLCLHEDSPLKFSSAPFQQSRKEHDTNAKSSSSDLSPPYTFNNIPKKMKKVHKKKWLNPKVYKNMHLRVSLGMHKPFLPVASSEL